MKKTNAILSALVLATASFGAQAADAGSKVSTLDVGNGFAAFGDQYLGNNSLNTFNDKIQFTFAGLSNLSTDVVSIDNSASSGLNLTGFALYDWNDTLLSAGTQASTGFVDAWTINYANLAAGSYYLRVSGNIVGNSSTDFAGNLALAPVPEPETYAMMLGGLGLLAFTARRRKQKEAQAAA